MSWQERIRQAFNARETQERQRIEKKRQEEEEAKRASMESKIIREEQLRKLRIALEEVGARELLKRVKRDVWRVGEISTESDPSYYEIHSLVKLEFTYRGYTSETVSDSDVHPGLQYVKKGLWKDRLSIVARVARFYGQDISFNVRDVKEFIPDGYITSPPKQMFQDRFCSTKEELEKLVLDSIENRIRKKRLPLDDIYVPWYKRIFN